MTKEQEKNIKYFEDNLHLWLEDIAYKHKHVVIANKKVQGVFDSFSDALSCATAHFFPGEFVIQQVIDENEHGVIWASPK